MSLGWKEAAGGLGAAAVGALVAVLVTGVRDRAADPAATGAAVRAYLLDHPEILPEAMERLQDRQTASAIAAVVIRIGRRRILAAATTASLPMETLSAPEAK